MRFYTEQHPYYCGIDLHARSMYVCIIDQTGKTLVHKNINTDPDSLLKLITPYISEIVLAVECIFTWYWIADFCHEHKIPFVLGHALYMKAIHGSKTKNDRIDSFKIAALLRAGMIPMAYVYPAEMRAIRDLLRRRMFPQPKHSKSIQTDLDLLTIYDTKIQELEFFITRHAKEHNPNDHYLLHTVPGIGMVIALVILYEIHDINRFATVQDFASYARLIKPKKESAGKTYSGGNRKIGNA